MKFTYIFFVIIVSDFWVGCTKFVEVQSPENSIVSINAFTNDQTATAVVAGIYSRMLSTQGFASGGINGSITMLCGLAADELLNFSPGNTEVDEFFHNAVLSDNNRLKAYLWNEPYQYIYTANAIIEGLNASNGVSAEVSQQLTGEAKFIRAFCYFYLTNLFGDVPLYLSTDYKKNSIAERSSSSSVYEQIVADLTEAADLLSEDYVFSQGERVRPNRYAAKALLSRVYLYIKNWAEAESVSSEIINNTALYSLLPNLNEVFLKNSQESIWQLMPVEPGYNTNEGRYFIISTSPLVETGISLSDSLINAFESPFDGRLLQWTGVVNDGGVDYYYPLKYKVQAGSDLSEYSIVFRVSEQYLIRAEARAMLNNISDAEDDLNMIRSRAGLMDVENTNSDALLAMIEKERRVELFFEWGHRWFDIKRSGNINLILSAAKPGDWQTTDTIMPVPLNEIRNNPRITQNAGYN